MVRPGYVPHKGDFITLSFDPQSGHEQKCRRPALVISNYLFTRHTGLAICVSRHQHGQEDPISSASSNILIAHRLRNGRPGEVRGLCGQAGKIP